MHNLKPLIHLEIRAHAERGNANKGGQTVQAVSHRQVAPRTGSPCHEQLTYGLDVLAGWPDCDSDCKTRQIAETFSVTPAYLTEARLGGP